MNPVQLSRVGTAASIRIVSRLHVVPSHIGHVFSQRIYQFLVGHLQLHPQTGEGRQEGVHARIEGVAMEDTIDILGQLGRLDFLIHFCAPHVSRRT